MNELQPVGSPGSEPQNGIANRRRRKVLILVGVSIGIILLLAAAFLPAFVKAKQRAQSTACVGNIKQINLSALLWAQDHGELFPPDWLSMSNEMVTPKILICPADRSKVPALDWSQFNVSKNLSYEFVVPGAKESGSFTQIVFRCPIHKHVGLVDGSVHRGQPL